MAGKYRVEFFQSLELFRTHENGTYIIIGWTVSIGSILCVAAEGGYIFLKYTMPFLYIREVSLKYALSENFRC